MNSAIAFVTRNVKPRTKHPGKWWVRIKPYSPNTGAVVQRIRVRKLGNKGAYVEANGWYSHALSHEQVKLLLNTHVNPHDPSTPCVFDVCTFEEATALDTQAKVKVKAAGGRRDASDAADNVFTMADLPPRRAARAEPSPEADDREVLDERREQQEPDAEPDEDDAALDADLDFDDME